MSLTAPMNAGPPDVPRVRTRSAPKGPRPAIPRPLQRTGESFPTLHQRMDIRRVSDRRYEDGRLRTNTAFICRIFNGALTLLPGS